MMGADLSIAYRTMLVGAYVLVKSVHWSIKITYLLWLVTCGLLSYEQGHAVRYAAPFAHGCSGLRVAFFHVIPQGSRGS